MAKYGVAPGRKTSTSFFSFKVQDMRKSINVPTPFLRDHNVLRLADDSALFTEVKYFVRSLFTNVGKTVFLHLSAKSDIEPLVLDNRSIIQSDKPDIEPLVLDNRSIIQSDKPDIEPLVLDNRSIIKSAKPDIEPLVLDNRSIIQSAKPDIEPLVLVNRSIIKSAKPDIEPLVLVNRSIIKSAKTRTFHVEYITYQNSMSGCMLTSTPPSVKVQVLYTCMFSAYLYGTEEWWGDRCCC